MAHPAPALRPVRAATHSRMRRQSHSHSVRQISDPPLQPQFTVSRSFALVPGPTSHKTAANRARIPQPAIATAPLFSFDTYPSDPFLRRKPVANPLPATRYFLRATARIVIQDCWIVVVFPAPFLQSTRSGAAFRALSKFSPRNRFKPSEFRV